MVQKIVIPGLVAGSGIVATLIILGGGVYITGISEVLGKLAIGSGFIIAIALGFLGVLGVAKRVFG